MKTADPIIHGSYRIPEVARWIGVNEGTVRGWFSQRSGSETPPLLASPYTSSRRERPISFLNVIEIRVIAKLLDLKVSPVEIRRARQKLAEQFELDHPFAERLLKTDGHCILIENKRGKGQVVLVEVSTGQLNMPSIVKQFLTDVNYHPNGQAIDWEISPGVILNPRIQFGHPVVSHSYILTDVLYEGFRAAKEDADEVARWYEIDPEEVLNAVRFEKKYRQRDRD